MCSEKDRARVGYKNWALAVESWLSGDSGLWRGGVMMLPDQFNYRELVVSRITAQGLLKYH